MLSRSDRPRRFAELAQGLEAQRHVIGALIMRELHTRYGRDNIGYLWLLAEPMMLAGAVALIHVGTEGTGGHHGTDLRVVPFTLTGYCVFIIFRSIVSRAETVLEANKPLLYHRMVTIFDMLLARAILEFLSSIAALAILLGGAVALDLGDPPARPLMLLAGILLFTWLSFALSMCVATFTHFSHVATKLLHPAIYILLPMSGAFFLLRWIPEPYRSVLAWSPIIQSFELVHAGQFASIENPDCNPVYVVGCCLALTGIGLLSLRVLRRNVHLS